MAPWSLTMGGGHPSVLPLGILMKMTGALSAGVRGKARTGNRALSWRHSAAGLWPAASMVLAPGRKPEGQEDLKECSAAGWLAALFPRGSSSKLPLHRTSLSMCAQPYHNRGCVQACSASGAVGSLASSLEATRECAGNSRGSRHPLLGSLQNPEPGTNLIRDSTELPRRLSRAHW